MAKPKYYAVRTGRKPGIYTTWEEASAQVQGYTGAVYKGFATRGEAEAFMKGALARPVQPSLIAVDPAPAAAPAPAGGDVRQVQIYSDGGCIRNPGPGGYGVVLISGGRRRELSGGFRLTTNNRMELMAVIAGLEALKEPLAATVYSDSRYLVNAMQSGSARRWQRSGWERKDGPVPNADLWQRLLDLAGRAPVRFEWVRGHAGNTENERCDQLAMQAAKKRGLPVDAGYEGGG